MESGWDMRWRSRAFSLLILGKIKVPEEKNNVREKKGKKGIKEQNKNPKYAFFMIGIDEERKKGRHEIINSFSFY